MHIIIIDILLLNKIESWFKMIIFQYFEGCPNADKTLENLKLVMKELNLTKINIVKIPNIEESKLLNFQGSPSILIDGIDIYTSSVPTTNNYSCRMYNINGKLSGTVPINYIREKLKELCK